MARLFDVIGKKVTDGEKVSYQGGRKGDVGGLYYKDPNAFHYTADEVCYIPRSEFYEDKTSVSGDGIKAYTFNDILNLCVGNKPFAKFIFNKLDGYLVEDYISALTLGKTKGAYSFVERGAVVRDKNGGMGLHVIDILNKRNKLSSIYVNTYYRRDDGATFGVVKRLLDLVPMDYVETNLSTYKEKSMKKEKTYRLMARTNGWIAQRDSFFNGKEKVVIESGLSLKEAQGKMLGYFNEYAGKECKQAANWGNAVNLRTRDVTAYPTEKNGCRTIEYDSRYFYMEEETE